MEPVQNRRFQDASNGENTPESRTTIGEGRQRGVAGAANRIEVLSDYWLRVSGFAGPERA
jgi:hypothetical protein